MTPTTHASGQPSSWQSSVVQQANTAQADPGRAESKPASPAQQLQRQLAELTAEAENPDQTVWTRVNSKGQLIGLQFRHGANKYKPADLARQILITASRATDRVKLASEKLVQQSLRKDS